MSAGKKYKYNTNAFVNEFNILKEEHWIARLMKKSVKNCVMGDYVACQNIFLLKSKELFWHVWIMIGPSRQAEVLENKWKLIFKYYRSIPYFSSNIQIWIFVWEFRFLDSFSTIHIY